MVYISYQHKLNSSELTRAVFNKKLVRYSEEVVSDDEDNQLVQIELGTGETLVFLHRQDCCESVYLESVDVNPELFIGGTILSLEERTSQIPEGTDRYWNECQQWTFYNLVTTKGTCVFRFYGGSNGYYGIEVDTYLTPNPETDKPPTRDEDYYGFS
jgi:hypothetical protein